nr:unnamed protein product [Digitaria exilis]
MFSDEASSVLDSLQPHPDLEELTIRGFSVETCQDVIFHAGQPEDVELVSCKPVWVQMGQPEEIELVSID